MTDCIFCQIIEGTIPSSTIYEDEEVKAFLDISQTTPGHSLVIPKNHSRNLLEMSEAGASQLFAPLPKLARALKKATGATGINIISNCEEAAGQTVFHTHIHLVPRYGQDDGISISYTTHEPDFPALSALASAIASEVDQ